MLSRRSLVVITLALGACGDPTSLSDGLRGLILFSKGHSRSTELLVIRPDGTGQRQLTHNTYMDLQPHWSPDRSQIVFISERDSVPGDPVLKPQVFVMNADGSNVRKLTNEPGRPNTPRWSPDGTRITFHQAGRHGLQQIHIMNADGSGVRSLTSGEVADFSAEWSPDGTKILFLSQRGSRIFATMYVMDSDGTNQRMLAGNNACTQNVTDPRWSPDGTRIAYACEGTLNVIGADGTDRVTLDTQTAGGGAYGYPVWSPDGRQLAFTGGRTAWDVYVIRSTGGPASRLTSDSESDFVYDWKRPR